jgi:hypothetical protein
MCTRAKRKDFKIPEECRILPEESVKLPEESPKTPEVCDKVKERKVKKKGTVSDETVSEASPPHPPEQRIDHESLIAWFNETTKGVFGKIRHPLAEQRKKMLAARIRTHGMQAFCDAVIKATQSDFLKGENRRGWCATFDWLIKPVNFDKVLSGNYDSKKTKEHGNGENNEDLLRGVAEGIARGYHDLGRQ